MTKFLSSHDLNLRLVESNLIRELNREDTPLLM
jgi:hypothetical protein